MVDVTLFAGPSACGIAPQALRRAGVRLRPPVRRGDVERLLARADRPGALVVCDGVFQCEPAASYAELCEALDRGWQVWGVSSIGAIRAYELRHEGMLGFGYVYSLFHEVDDFTDDEMCLLHFPESPYFPVSEALVNLRYALREQGRALGISSDAAAPLGADLRALWFGDRTEERIRRIMVERIGIWPANADRLLDWMRHHRVKTLDLSDLLTQRPWGAPRGAARSPPRPASTSMRPSGSAPTSGRRRAPPSAAHRSRR